GLHPAGLLVESGPLVEQLARPVRGRGPRLRERGRAEQRRACERYDRKTARHGHDPFSFSNIGTGPGGGGALFGGGGTGGATLGVALGSAVGATGGATGTERGFTCTSPGRSSLLCGGYTGASTRSGGGATLGGAADAGALAGGAAGEGAGGCDAAVTVGATCGVAVGAGTSSVAAEVRFVVAARTAITAATRTTATVIAAPTDPGRRRGMTGGASSPGAGVSRGRNDDGSSAAFGDAEASLVHGLAVFAEPITGSR